MFLFCQSNNETTFSAVSAKLCGFIQDQNSGLRTQPKNWKNPMGSVDCKSKEMIVEIICHIEVLKLNHEAIVWQ